MQLPPHALLHHFSYRHSPSECSAEMMAHQVANCFLPELVGDDNVDVFSRCAGKNASVVHWRFIPHSIQDPLPVLHKHIPQRSLETPGNPACHRATIGSDKEFHVG